MHLSLLLFAAVPVFSAAIADPECKGSAYAKRTCCMNQVKHVDKYNSDFYGYDCSLKDYGRRIGLGLVYCAVQAKAICCTDEDGWLVPLGGPYGFIHSEPRNFRCDGLDDGPEDPPR